MKTLFLLAAICMSSQLFSQTTQEEYTWVTKSYIRVLTEGADIKRGYVIADLISPPQQTSVWGNQNKFDFKFLKKEKAAKPQALIIVHYFNDAVKTV